MLRIAQKESFGPEQILWYDLSNGQRTWNVRSQYRSGSLTAAARELARYSLDLVDVQVRWDKGGTGRAVDYISYRKETKSIIPNRIFCTHRIVPAVKRVELVNDRVSYIRVVLRGRWCNIIVLNVHATSEKKSDDSKKIVFMRNQGRFFIIFLRTI